MNSGRKDGPQYPKRGNRGRNDNRTAERSWTEDGSQSQSQFEGPSRPYTTVTSSPSPRVNYAAIVANQSSASNSWSKSPSPLTSTPTPSSNPRQSEYPTLDKSSGPHNHGGPDFPQIGERRTSVEPPNELTYLNKAIHNVNQNLPFSQFRTYGRQKGDNKLQPEQHKAPITPASSDLFMRPKSKTVKHDRSNSQQPRVEQTHPCRRPQPTHLQENQERESTSVPSPNGSTFAYPFTHNAPSDLSLGSSISQEEHDSPVCVSVESQDNCLQVPPVREEHSFTDHQTVSSVSSSQDNPQIEYDSNKPSIPETESSLYVPVKHVIHLLEEQLSLYHSSIPQSAKELNSRLEDLVERARMVQQEVNTLDTNTRGTAFTQQKTPPLQVEEASQDELISLERWKSLRPKTLHTLDLSEDQAFRICKELMLKLINNPKGMFFNIGRHLITVLSYYPNLPEQVRQIELYRAKHLLTGLNLGWNEGSKNLPAKCQLRLREPAPGSSTPLWRQSQRGYEHNEPSCRQSQFFRPELPILYSSSASFVLTRLESTPFQTHCLTENIKVPGIEPGYQVDGQTRQLRTRIALDLDNLGFPWHQHGNPTRRVDKRIDIEQPVKRAALYLGPHVIKSEGLPPLPTLKQNPIAYKYLKDCAEVVSPSDIVLGELIKASEEFPIEFPVQGVRCTEILKHEDITDKVLEDHANSAYPLLHESALYLYTEFLDHKRKYGTATEKAVYDKMGVVDLVQRLLEKRAVTFYGKRDAYLLISGKKGVQGWEYVGKDNGEEKPPLVLEQVLSYDEMKLSALLSVSSHSTFINDGNRNNKGEPSSPKDLQRHGVIVGLIGTRLSRPNFMEWQEIVVTKRQNVELNGYGQPPGDTANGARAPTSLNRWRKVWSDFYGITPHLPTYEELSEKIESLSAADQARYLKLPGHTGIFDNDMFKKRLSVSIDTLLLEAEHRAAERNTTAYIHVVGIGLGVWKCSKHQEEVFLEAFADCLARLQPRLSHVSDINFAWFYEKTCGGTSHGKTFRTGDSEGHIRMFFSKRPPHERLSDPRDAGKLLVVSYAWDGNALPGNEFWVKKLSSSGDPAAACSTQVAELHNPHINKKVVGTNLHVASPSLGVLHLADYVSKKLAETRSK
uniref:Uncharacterized protein n=1 Tax=Timema monikensis TaxID=170555 RepID=A0A7R9EEF4_9NEOP|nr:unnamed protein product [Timema monikensis]